MSYSIFIERPENPLTLDEWSAALDVTSGVRLKEGEGHSITNPANGQTITIGSADGDAEIYDPEDEQWHSAILWRDSGCAHFNSRVISHALSFREFSNPLWVAISTLTKTLGAQLRGEEGETYDLDPQ